MFHKTYKITPEDDSIEPEEAILDFGEHPRIEKSLGGNYFLLFYLLILGLGILLGRAFDLQLIQGRSFYKLSQENLFVKHNSRAPRGIIYDRNGIPLTNNALWYNILAFSEQLPADLEARKFIYKELSQILNLNEEQILNKVENQRQQAVVIIEEGIDKKSADKINERKLAGIFTQNNFKREYIKNPLMAHILGYTGLIAKDDLNQDNSYEITDIIGRSGLEEYYEKYLRGEKGEIIFNKLTKNYGSTEPQKGLDLLLSLDVNLQKVLYTHLKSAVSQVRFQSGAAIIQNPKNGRILALVSFPDFDNNIFSSRVKEEDYEKITKKLNQPFLNRVISGRYSPGSTIKPLIAIASLEENIISPLKKIFSSGSISLVSPFDPEIIYTFNDWRAHGYVDMRQAIAVSSDVYFYEVGGGYEEIEGLGIERIGKYLSKFLLDKKLGIDLPSEAAGFAPSKEWKLKTENQPWYTGDSYNVSIGQGDLAVTPLWLNSYISALANGGTIYKPQLVDKILDINKNTVQSFKPQKLAENLADPKNIKIAQEGMKMAVEEGTAQILKALSVPAAAKTGTAEVVKGRSTNAWFTAFAPYDNPEVVITVLIQAGKEGSSLPSQVAFNVLQYYFAR